MSPSDQATQPTQNVPPDRPRRRVHRVLRWIEHFIVAVALGIVIFIASPIPAWIYADFDCQGELRHAKYIICLGGNSSRVIESVRLLQEGWAEKLIVSNHDRFADQMRDLAVDWGAEPAKIVVDHKSWTTRDHPRAVEQAAGIDPANDVCIIVTSYTHMQRARACFEKAGYKHVIIREPRWERDFRAPEESTWKARFMIFPHLVYECAAWVEYWLRGAI